MRDINLDWKCKHQKFICRLFLVRKRNRCPLKKEKKKKIKKRREIDQSVRLVTFLWDKSSICGRYL